MPSPRTKPSLTSLIAFGFCLLPLVYVLSIGPVAALDDSGYIEVNLVWARAVYWPLGWCCERSESFASAIDWYIELWTE